MRVVAGVLFALVLVGGCGGDGEDRVASEPTASATPEPEAATPKEPESSKTSDAERSKRVKQRAARKAAMSKAAARKAAVARRAAAVKAAAKAAAARKAARRFAVLDVVDGDTVRVDYRGGVSVRVIGIDTPETVSPSVADECGGQAASSAARKLLAGKSVTMAFDPTQDRADKYGRPLVYLGVPGVGDFGRAMIQRGQAAEYTYDAAYQRQAGYRAAERSARGARRGLWGACGGPDRPLKKPRPKPVRVAGGSGSRCAAGYSPCVPPFPPDVNCDDVAGPIAVTGSDPHELDSDGDRVACES